MRQLITNKKVQEEVEFIACRICGQHSLEFIGICPPFLPYTLQWFRENKEPSNARGSLYKCLNCGIGLRIPCLSIDQLADFYQAIDVGEMPRKFEENAAWVESKSKLIEIFSDSDNPTILDIGCYEGEFLKGMPEKWQKFGIEPSKAKRIPVEHGIHIIEEWLEKPSKEWENYFDAATMFDVFEHLLHPVQSIINAMKYLKPGGRLLISTGNMDSWTWSWSLEDHWYLQTPLHITFASNDFFYWMAENYSNLRIVDIKPIPHKLGSFQEKYMDIMALLYLGLRKRGRFWRVPQCIIHSIPIHNYLRHAVHAPWAFTITDHFLVELEKQNCM